MQRIDTHQHILLPEHFSYPWTADFAPLQGRFGLDDYQKAAQGREILGTLFMEVDVDAAESGDEARYFCTMAESPESGIIGVVSSGRPENTGFLKYLDSIAHPALKGIRRVLHVVPDQVSQTTTFRENVHSLAQRNLTFDICVRADQLSLALELVDACPATQFILDHCGCPDIASGDFEAWKDAMAKIAKRDNVVVKISGLPAYCKEGQANAETLRPWVETAIEVFGWDRAVWGGDWPVCTINGTLQSWCDALEEILAGEPEENLEKLYTLNAKRIYRL